MPRATLMPNNEAPANSAKTSETVAPATVSQAAAWHFGTVSAGERPDQVATACMEALKSLLHVPSVRLVVPLVPVPVISGAPPAGLHCLLRFPLSAGEGEVWAAGDVDWSAAARAAVAEHLSRIWRVQEERAAQAQELDRLRFQLASLQQVARTLALVRGVEETERLVLDSVGEVFFAWWAALYRLKGDVYRTRAVRSLRGDTVADVLPADVVHDALTTPGSPFVPGQDAPIRTHVGAEIAVAAPLELQDGDPGLLLLGPRMTELPYETHDLALLRALADSSAIALRNAHLMERLRAQATLDPLTGCQNRRGFDERLAVEFARAVRYDRPLTLVLLDIDHFKRLNDEFGHEAGDDALRRLGRTLRHSFRSTDDACRYGGEEFALIFPETGKDEGAQIADRLRIVIEAIPPDPEIPRPLTASLGVAAFPVDARTPTDLVRAADRALYQAKAAGRNCVRTA